MYLDQLQQLSPDLHAGFTADNFLVEEVLDRVLDGSFEVDPDLGGGDDEWEDEEEAHEPAGNPQPGNNIAGQINPNLFGQPALTAADEENLNHLISLTGHNRARCIEAYIVCNKNVEQAANLLLDGN